MKNGPARLVGQWEKLEHGVQSRSCLYIAFVLIGALPYGY